MNPTAARWLLGALTLVIIPHLLQMPVWLGSICVAALAWRFNHDRNGWALPRGPIKLLLIVAAIAAVVLSHQTALGSQTATSLLAVLFCLKLIEMRSDNDGRVVVILGYFMAITAFFSNQSPWMFFYMLAVVVALTTSLVALAWPTALIAGRSLLHVGGQLVLHALPIMVVLFLLFPRPPGPLGGAPRPAASITGLSNEMTIGNVGELADSRKIAFRVWFLGKVPSPSQLYWRGPVLADTDGSRWSGSDDPWQRLSETLPEADASNSHIDYVVTLEPHGQHWLLPLDRAALIPSGAVMTKDAQLLTIHPIIHREVFTLRSVLGGPNELLDPRMKAVALELPTGRNPKTVALGQQWLAEGLSEAARVERALSLFRDENFHYTRRPPVLGLDPLDGFLFQSKRGFCEHYAGALTVLMRAAGLPARVILGYQGGRLDPFLGDLVVRQSDAHAWVEVYLSNSGWTRVDPTLVIPPQRIEHFVDRYRFSQESSPWRDIQENVGFVWDRAGFQWSYWILEYNLDRQQDLLTGLGMGWGLLAVICLSLLYLAVRGGDRRRRKVEPALAMYTEFCSRLARKGITRAVNEGPDDFLQRIITSRPDLGARATKIIRLYVDLRYRHCCEQVESELRRELKSFRP